MTFRRLSLRRQLYEAFIQPQQLEQSLRNRETVFNVVLLSTGVLMSVLLILLLQSFISGNQQLLGRLSVAVLGVGLVASLRWLARRGHYFAAAYALVGFYALLAIGSVMAWDISTPFGIVLLGLVIVLASTLLSSRHALYAGLLSSLTVIVVQVGNQAGWITSHAPNSGGRAQLGDAIGEAAVFTVLATISWLFGREMERSLLRAEAAEAALSKDKANLEIRVAERTKQLKQAQLEEMRQLYRFAEIGQLSTALLHDLANYVTVLTVEIGSMQSKRYTETLARCRAAIERLNATLEEVRERLNQGPVKRRYSLVDAVTEAVQYSLRKDRAGRVDIVWQPPSKKGFEWYGDAVKCSQIIAILISNAIDAYAGVELAGNQKPQVVVQAVQKETHVQIIVTDWGVGIAPRDRTKIFKSDYGTKKHGMGIGLYLARQMVVTEFEGSLSLSPATNRTEFVLALPRKRHAG